jgi:hypothetical protein
MKCAFVGVQGKAQRRAIARYGKELQRRHAPPQACNSPCSVTHPVGESAYRTLFLLEQQISSRMERSTDFFRFRASSLPTATESKRFGGRVNN